MSLLQFKHSKTHHDRLNFYYFCSFCFVFKYQATYSDGTLKSVGRVSWTWVTRNRVCWQDMMYAHNPISLRWYPKFIDYVSQHARTRPWRAHHKHITETLHAYHTIITHPYHATHAHRTIYTGTPFSYPNGWAFSFSVYFPFARATVMNSLETFLDEQEAFFPPCRAGWGHLHSVTTTLFL